MEQWQENLDQLASGFDQIPEERKKKLEQLSLFLKNKVTANEIPSVNFICTHNSRRSQIAQLWFLASAAYFDLGEVKSFSGGTEGTAFNGNAVAAMQAKGFPLERISEGPNPHYQLAWAGEQQEFWSKVFSEAPNPTRGFAAVMVCSDADEACPFVPGAEKRISLPFEDPKKSDGSGQEAKVYGEAAQIIGREIGYAVKRAKELLETV